MAALESVLEDLDTNVRMKLPQAWGFGFTSMGLVHIFGAFSFLSDVPGLGSVFVIDVPRCIGRTGNPIRNTNLERARPHVHGGESRGTEPRSPPYLGTVSHRTLTGIGGCRAGREEGERRRCKSTWATFDETQKALF